MVGKWERTIGRFLVASFGEFIKHRWQFAVYGNSAEDLREWFYQNELMLWERARKANNAAAEYIIAECLSDIVWEEVIEVIK